MKKLRIILLTFGLSLFLVVSLSETFLNDFIKIQRDLYLKSKKTQNLEVSKVFWENQTDKNEIQINGSFYDVISVKKSDNTVTIEVVHDEYELIIKYLSKNLHKKNKLLKYKKSIELLPLIEHKLILIPIKSISKNNFSFSVIMENKIITPFFHPPTFI